MQDRRNGCLLAIVAGVAVLAVPISANAQSIERGVIVGAGYASSSFNEGAGDSGSGPVFLGGVTFQTSKRVFVDLDVTYGKRDFELARGLLLFDGADLGVATSFGVLLVTNVPVQPFLGAGLGFLRSSSQVRPESAVPVPALLATATETTWGAYLQLGGGARVFVTESLFLQAEWMVLFRQTERLPDIWKVGTLALGYRF